MGDFFAELKRRHIYRVAAAYAVVAWVLVQLVNNLAPIFDLPPWIARAVVLLLIVGFPITLLIAWMHELAPADGATARAITSKLDWALMGALIVVIVLVSYQQLASSSGGTTVQQRSNAAPPSLSAQPGGISVAVLPFVNLSSDKEQEFFSDGMTEEITSALSKVPNLQVVGRTSAFQFKGQNKDLSAIGQALHATHLIEGSVRKDGNEVRITAQLIRADNGTHLWTESYNRELKGVFAMQEEIATAIASALRVPLGLKPGENLVNNRGIDPESYQQYLRARALLRARSPDEAISVLEPLVGRDPNFAPAWALLANSYRFAPIYNQASTGSGSLEEQRRAFETSLDKVELPAREAIRLDPKHAGGYAQLASVETARGRLLGAEDLYRQALALDPNDPEVLDGYSQWLVNAGRLKDLLRLRERLHTLEPFVASYNIGTAEYMRLNGQNDAAIQMLEVITPGETAVAFTRNRELANAYATAGRFGEGADTLLAIAENQNRVSRRTVEDAARLLRSAPAKVSAADALPVIDELSFVYKYVGAPNRVLDQPEHFQEIGARGPVAFAQLWDPLNAPVRKTDRFKALMRKSGLVDYWRARGWPDLCRPMGADDFVCE